MVKTKVTLNVEEKIRKNVQKVLDEKHLTLSGIVENYLKFVANPDVYCFKCGKNFTVNESSVCPKCSFLTCPDCKSCGCPLSEETRVAVFYMNRTYEELLGGRLE